MNTIEPVNTDL